MSLLNKENEPIEKVLKKDKNWVFNYRWGMPSRWNKKTTRFYECYFTLVYNSRKFGRQEYNVNAIYFPPEFEGWVSGRLASRADVKGRVMFTHSRDNLFMHVSNTIEDAMDLDMAIYDYCQQILQSDGLKGKHFELEIENVVYKKF